MDNRRERGRKLEVDPPSSSEPPRQNRETVRPRARGSATEFEAGGSPPQNHSGHSGTASGTNRPMILSILYLTSLVFGLTGLVAFILALVWKSTPEEEWEVSHFQYQTMTFLLWLGATVIGIILIFTIIGALIGIPLVILAVVLVLVRAIMSLIRAQNREPMPNPGTWLA